MPTSSHSIKCIAIVEDDHEVRSLLHEFLDLSGYIVHSFADAPAFFENFDKAMNPFSLIISDINMPTMSGFDLLKLIKSKNQKLPVMLISASKNRNDEEFSKKLGADLFLHKPFQLKEFFRHVGNLTDRGQ